MKIWLLYDNPWDDGDDVYGAFSSEEKAEKAREVFQPKANHELYVREFELDELEKFFEKALSSKRAYIGHAMKYNSPSGETVPGEWRFSACGLDDLLGEYRKNHLIETSYLGSYVIASSEKEALEITQKLFIKLLEQEKDELGWRFVEE